MIESSRTMKHYSSAAKRLLKAAIERFFDLEFPRFFGPAIRDQIAQRIIELVEQQMPAKEHVRPGQCVWNAVAVDTRPDSPKMKTVPVILTLVDEGDISRLAAGERLSAVTQDTIARMMREAHQQGGLVGVRDIALLLQRHDSNISVLRKAWEETHNEILPHPGSLQDFGSCISHKAIIVQKVVYQKKDPRRVASETKHSQRAVDRYLRDFRRVETCFRSNPDVDFICQVTGMSKQLAKQYVQIIENNENKPLTGNLA